MHINKVTCFKLRTMKQLIIGLTKIVGGFAILIIGMIPILLTMSFIMSIDSKESWLTMMSELPETSFLIFIIIVTVMGLGVSVSGLMLMISSMKYSHVKDVQLLTPKYPDPNECLHETVHQVGFTDKLACDECGALFENPHFIEANK